jgi:HEAT repeat protein
VEALGRLNDPRAVGPLCGLLGDQEAAVREVAVAIVMRFPSDAVAPLVATLQNSSPLARLTAVRCLGQLNNPRAVQPLCDLLTDKDTAVRRAAVEALGRLNDPRAVGPLCGLLGDQDATMREAVVAIVMRFPGDAFEPLLATLQNSSPHARLTAVKCLGQLNDPRAVEPLCGLLTDTDAAVRRAAVEALGNIGHRNALPALKSRLRWLRGETDQNVLAAIRAAIEKIEEATKHLKGKPRAAEAEILTPDRRPRAAEDTPTAEGRPREG